MIKVDFYKQANSEEVESLILILEQSHAIQEKQEELLYVERVGEKSRSEALSEKLKYEYASVPNICIKNKSQSGWEDDAR